MGIFRICRNIISYCGRTSGRSWIAVFYNCGVRIIDFVKDDLIPAATSVVNAIVDGVKKIGRDVSKFIDSVTQFFGNIISKSKDWFNKNFNAGYIYATSNPYININTTTMDSYANQLRILSKRAKTLDGKMNSLYWHLGIEWDTIANLGKLLRAGVILDFAYRLDKCANYLSDTARDFDAVERDLQGMC